MRKALRYPQAVRAGSDILGHPPHTPVMTSATHYPMSPRIRVRLVRHGSGGPAFSRRTNELPIMRGYPLVTSPDLAPWEQRTAVSLARAIAALHRASAARCLTHSSAALVLGLGMWTQEPDIHLATASRPRRTATLLPAVRYPRTGPPTPAPGGSATGGAGGPPAP